MSYVAPGRRPGFKEVEEALSLLSGAISKDQLTASQKLFLKCLVQKLDHETIIEHTMGAMTIAEEKHTLSSQALHEVLPSSSSLTNSSLTDLYKFRHVRDITINEKVVVKDEGPTSTILTVESKEVAELKGELARIQQQLDRIKEIKSRARKSFIHTLDYPVADPVSHFITLAQINSQMTSDERIECEMVGELRARMTLLSGRLRRIRARVNGAFVY